MTHSYVCHDSLIYTRRRRRRRSLRRGVLRSLWTLKCAPAHTHASMRARTCARTHGLTKTKTKTKTKSLKIRYTDLQNAATHCTTLQHTATHCNTLEHTATHCNTPKSLRSGTLIHKTLLHTATHCNTLQHTATHCNTLQHIEESHAQVPHASKHTATMCSIL